MSVTSYVTSSIYVAADQSQMERQVIGFRESRFILSFAFKKKDAMVFRLSCVAGTKVKTAQTGNKSNITTFLTVDIFIERFSSSTWPTKLTPSQLEIGIFPRPAFINLK